MRFFNVNFVVDNILKKGVFIILKWLLVCRIKLFFFVFMFGRMVCVMCNVLKKLILNICLVIFIDIFLKMENKFNLVLFIVE